MQYKHWIQQHPSKLFLAALSAPFIYAVLFPVMLFDIILEIYHRVCFPLYGLEYIKRSDYIRLDRWKLPYIPWYERINCLYCEYVNGFLGYAVAVAGRTELFWCGIKHKSGGGFQEPEHHKAFLPYEDVKAYEKVS